MPAALREPAPADTPPLSFDFTFQEVRRVARTLLANFLTPFPSLLATPSTTPPATHAAATVSGSAVAWAVRQDGTELCVKVTVELNTVKAVTELKKQLKQAVDARQLKLTLVTQAQ